MEKENNNDPPRRRETVPEKKISSQNVFKEKDLNVLKLSRTVSFSSQSESREFRRSEPSISLGLPVLLETNTKTPPLRRKSKKKAKQEKGLADLVKEDDEAMNFLDDSLVRESSSESGTSNENQILKIGDSVEKIASTPLVTVLRAIGNWNESDEEISQSPKVAPNQILSLASDKLETGFITEKITSSSTSLSQGNTELITTEEESEDLSSLSTELIQSSSFDEEVEDYEEKNKTIVIQPTPKKQEKENLVHNSNEEIANFLFMINSMHDEISLASLVRAIFGIVSLDLKRYDDILPIHLLSTNNRDDILQDKEDEEEQPRAPEVIHNIDELIVENTFSKQQEQQIVTENHAFENEFIFDNSWIPEHIPPEDHEKEQEVHDEMDSSKNIASSETIEEAANKGKLDVQLPPLGMLRAETFDAPPPTQYSQITLENYIHVLTLSPKQQQKKNPTSHAGKVKVFRSSSDGKKNKYPVHSLHASSFPKRARY